MTHTADLLAFMEEKGGWLTCQQIAFLLEEDGYFERERITRIDRAAYVSRWLQRLYRMGKVQQRYDGYRSEWKAFARPCPRTGEKDGIPGTEYPAAPILSVPSSPSVREQENVPDDTMNQITKKVQVSLSLSQLHDLDAMVADGYADNRGAAIRRLLNDYQKEREK